MNDQTATLLYRTGTLMADVVAKSDDVVAKIEAEGLRLRRHNRPLYGLLAGIILSLGCIAFELHGLSSLLRSTLNAPAAASQPQPPR